MLKQKPNQLALPMMVVLIVALVVLSLFLIRTVSNLIFNTSDDTTVVDANSVSVAESFDYTRDRDQYWQPAVSVVEPFDYRRDRDQYETTYTATTAPFDYTRDRDQYWQQSSAAEPFDYTRDRDQYWQDTVPFSEPFDYTRDRDQYWQRTS